MQTHSDRTALCNMTYRKIDLTLHTKWNTKDSHKMKTQNSVTKYLFFLAGEQWDRHSWNNTQTGHVHDTSVCKEHGMSADSEDWLNSKFQSYSIKQRLHARNLKPNYLLPWTSRKNYCSDTYVATTPSSNNEMSLWVSKTPKPYKFHFQGTSVTLPVKW